jgi:hypothetical protein
LRAVRVLRGRFPEKRATTAGGLLLFPKLRARTRYTAICSITSISTTHEASREFASWACAAGLRMMGESRRSEFEETAARTDFYPATWPSRARDSAVGRAIATAADWKISRCVPRQPRPLTGAQPEASTRFYSAIVNTVRRPSARADLQLTVQNRRHRSDDAGGLSRSGRPADRSNTMRSRAPGTSRLRSRGCRRARLTSPASA